MQRIYKSPGSQYGGVNEKKNSNHDEQLVIFDHLRRKIIIIIMINFELFYEDWERLCMVCKFRMESSNCV